MNNREGVRDRSRFRGSKKLPNNVVINTKMMTRECQ